ncbi:unnamed protein product [Larinioides sclopetarius]|uniref:3'-5' exonuclease domain-containing protein n=1 Tax=Larinioides sclopetarius TaxID=280406 RepID=A0AAV2B1W6_9ARAC
MTSPKEFLGLLNCTIRFSTPEGEYEGVVRQVHSNAKIIVIGKLILLPDRRMGCLNFGFAELSDIRIICRPADTEVKNTEVKDVLPVYPKTEVEKLFDFDEGSDIEDGECADDRQEAYKMKLVPHLSKFIPKDYEIIDSFNQDFSLAIKHIKKQDAIGVSLEGIDISRSGTLTWLCVSTKSCNFLFDFLSLGEDAFKKGLKSILENAGIQKIFHDCRLASDCLYHKYGVRLDNVFDTQVADFVVMMQMVKKEKIKNRVNTLDACLNYYLEVPFDYLYGNTNFDSNKDSLNFHALRPLRHDIQDVLIKNVMYLPLLKREIELALMIPLRRATDVYLNSIQKLRESELLIVPHKPDELPLDMHLEGIQIFRYKDFEYACSTVASGPPYRKINNPTMNYLNYCAEYKNGQKEDKESIVNKDAIQNANVISSEENCKANVNYSRGSKSASDMAPVGFKSFNKSSEIDQECSDGSEKNQSTKLNESTTVKNPIMRGMLELISRTSCENLKIVQPTSEQSSQVNRCNSQNSVEDISVLKNSSTRHSSSSSEFNTFKSACIPPDTNNVSKTEISQLCRPTLGRKSPSELLELISKKKFSNPLRADTSSNEHSVKDSISTSESVCKKTCKERLEDIEVVKSATKFQPAHINDSVAVSDEKISDSDLEDVAARVRARGALLRSKKIECSASDCLSTSNAFSRKTEVQDSKKSDENSPADVEHTSENVTIYYSDTLDKPSQFVVTINHKSCRLTDLYKKAGDGNLLCSEEDSESLCKLSPEQPKKYENDDNFWASVLGDRSCERMDEKLRSRLIPAGMSGY